MVQEPQQRAGSLGMGTDRAAGIQPSAISTPETSEDEASPASGRRDAKQKKSPLSSQVLAKYVFTLYERPTKITGVLGTTIGLQIKLQATDCFVHAVCAVKWCCC